MSGRRLRLSVVAGSIALGAVAAFSQQVAVDDDARLDRALAAIEAAKIRADVAFIASDELLGRDTPSPGQRIAARFLQNRLERLGWKPGAKEGWLQRYPLIQRAVDESGCGATATRGPEKLELVLARDYAFSPLEAASLDVQGGVVYLGKVPDSTTASLPASHLIDVKGRWVLFDEPGGDLQALTEPLREAGAIGVLTTIRVISNLGGDPTGGLVFRLWSQLMTQGRALWPAKGPLLPHVHLSDASIGRLLGLAGAPKPKVGQLLPIEFQDRRRLKIDSTVDAENVVGFWRGSDPELAKDVVILSAHYDHLGVGVDGRVFNGADDNGSGTCALLAIAEALASYGPLECSVMLAWVSGEERGLWGSRWFVEQPWFPEGTRPIANVNLDMVGRNAARQLLLSPFEPASRGFGGLSSRARDIAAEEGFTELKSADGYYERSDQANFAKLGIPVLFFFSDEHADYHATTDDAEKVDADKVARVARVTFKLLVELQGDPVELSR